MTRLCTIGSLLVTLACASAPARPVPAPVQTPEAIETGALYVRIDPPMSGVEVSIDADGPGKTLRACPDSDERGLILCEGVPGGQHHVFFEYIPDVDNWTVVGENPVPVTITVSANTDIVIKLTPAIGESSPAPSWTKAQLLDMQGDLMVWLPALRPDCSTGEDPTTHIRCGARGVDAGWVWTLDLPRYSAEKRELFYQEERRLGYTHVAIQVAQPAADGGYHNLRPMTAADVAAYGPLMNTIHDELVAHQLIPICAGVAPDAPPAAGFDTSKCLVAMTDWDNNTHAAGRIRAIAEAFPNAWLFYERPQAATQAQPDGDSDDTIQPTPTNGGAWIRSIQQRYPKFVGVLYEVNHPDGLTLCLQELALAHAWWRDVQEVLFETDTYWKFWENLGVDEAVRFNDGLLTQAPQLNGFMSGATTHAPLATAPASETPMTGTGDQMDVATAQIVEGPDVRAWPITTTLTRIDLTATGVHVVFDKQDGPNRWPDNITPGWQGALQYSLCMGLQISGRWYVNCPIEFWHGLEEGGGPIQATGQIPQNWFYDARWGAMQGYQPQPGESIGLFVVAGDARNNFNPVHERSNVAVVPLPAPGAGATFILHP